MTHQNNKENTNSLKKMTNIKKTKITMIQKESKTASYDRVQPQVGKNQAYYPKIMDTEIKETNRRPSQRCTNTPRSKNILASTKDWFHKPTHSVNRVNQDVS